MEPQQLGAPPIEVSVQPFDASTITLPAGSSPTAS